MTADPQLRNGRESFRHIRNYLAGQALGTTQDRGLLEEVIKVLFCKILFVRKSIAISDDPETLQKEYNEAFTEIKLLLPETFANDDRLNLAAEALSFLDNALNAIDIEAEEHDPFGDAYEAFLGTSIRGEEGQFFTPQNAVDLLVHMTNPQPGERVIDPACGAGGFLARVARRFYSADAKPDVIHESIFGIDKDASLVRLTSARLALTTLQLPNVVCGDSLAFRSDDDRFKTMMALDGQFDVVLTNPPFGARIVAANKSVQETFLLGRKWGKVDDALVPLSEMASRVPPQVLFVERCLSLVRPGGRVGMVVPESLLSGKSYRHVMQFIADRSEVEAVVGMPESLFKTSGKGGTHTKTCLLLLTKTESPRQNRRIFMADAKWSGNDSRGRRIDRDDLPLVRRRFNAWRSHRLRTEDHLGFSLEGDRRVNNILVPRYYDPEVRRTLDRLETTHDLVEIGRLISESVIEIRSGDEVGKLAYGEGSVPFVRTSDLSNWEVKVDPKHRVSDDVYERLRHKQDVREGDILMVRDGTYLIGTCAYVTRYDARIVFQSHLYKIRTLQPEVLSPFLLLALLSSPPVLQQIRAKRFTQDIIDSLGDRIKELVLPVPKDPELRIRITELVSQSIAERVEARELARKARFEVVGLAAPSMVDDATDIEL